MIVSAVQALCAILIGFHVSNAFYQAFPSKYGKAHLLPLHGSKRGSHKKSSSSKSKRDTSAARTSRTEGLATDLPTARVAGIEEDHRFEQFYYNDLTQRKLFRVVQRFEHPLLLCNPSLAILADTAGMDYLLLDRDRRFSFLKGYKEFSLKEPFLVDYPYDAVFIDPPFANISPADLRRCLDLMAPDEHRRSKVPLFVAYNSKREQQLISAMRERGGTTLELKWHLNYMSVREDMQDNIALYGSTTFLC